VRHRAAAQVLRLDGFHGRVDGVQHAHELAEQVHAHAQEQHAEGGERERRKEVQARHARDDGRAREPRQRRQLAVQALQHQAAVRERDAQLRLDRIRRKRRRRWSRWGRRRHSRGRAAGCQLGAGGEVVVCLREF